MISGGWWLGASPLIQQAHPQRLDKYRRYDLFAPDMIHSCLNRLQLANNLQMVNLADPIGSFKWPQCPTLSPASVRRGWVAAKPADADGRMSWDIAAQTGAGVAQDINRTACSDLDALLAWLVPWCPGSMDASVRSPAISGRAPISGYAADAARLVAEAAHENDVTWFVPRKSR